MLELLNLESLQDPTGGLRRGSKKLCVHAKHMHIPEDLEVSRQPQRWPGKTEHVVRFSRVFWFLWVPNRMSDSII